METPKNNPLNLYAISGGKVSPSTPALPKRQKLPTFEERLDKLEVQAIAVKKSLEKNQDMLDEIYDRFNKIETRLLALSGYVARIATILEDSKLL
jgi:hypothetical protein